MATTLNASSSSNGLIASGDASGNLALQGNGTTGLTIDLNGKINVPNIALGTAVAGMMEYDGKVPYFTPSGTQRGVMPGMQYYRLNADLVGANVATVQNILGVGVTLSSNTVYEFNALFILTKTLGTTAHTIGIGFGGTSTINNILYQELGSNYAGGLSGGNTNSSVSQITINSTSNQTIIPSTSTASVFAWIRIFGTVSINAGGTFIPQYKIGRAHV